MNQDHVSQNPPADKYMNGTPSSWAEDVQTPNRWQSEYAGGTTKRNEIGQPDFRSETFSHPERTASVDQGLVLKKADLCATVARMMLPKTASEITVEDQAVELMGLSDAAVIDTYNRLANQQDQQGQGQEQQQQQQATQQDQQGQGQDQQQQQQATQQTQTAMQQCIEAFQQGDQGKFLAALQQMQSGQGAFPGGQWGKNNPVATAQPKKAQDQGQQGQGQQGQEQQQQQQQASQSQLAMYQQQTQAMQQQIQAMQDQIQQLLQGQQGQGQQQGQQQIQEQGLVQASDDELLAEMMASSPTGGAVGEPTAELDVQLDPSAMDMSEISVTAEEQAQLNQLFASPELHAAEQQQQQQGQQQGQGQGHQAALRSPSTRTVGTQPSQGVRKVGGVGAPVVKTAAAEVSDLAKLWNTAPDVREAFGIPT